MKRRPPSHKLQIESLEERRLTATLAGSFSSISSAPTSNVALESTVKPIEQVSLSRGLVETGTWTMGIRLNHNETLVRARRRLKVESLEARRMMTTLTGSFSSITSAPTSDIALVSTITPIQQVSLSPALVDASSWKMGLTRNHNETLVRAGRQKREGRVA